ncbi:phenylalanine--tRNA ligase subunit beta [candidate division WWE3 bacterium CG_4_10_14_0_2_um_filter_42_7]|uniref:Phenylalanine--tRNA ligase beta subunit n=2 Tax=Katanobacteria TaxID=422282 RepID=A0A2H0XBV2_UNCKA|nr:MAG: phenylalanine--tRNA ligase subunit beta [candidate division WWE3 bacterium CG08_land_8_20_14_0_20_41_15]PIZ43909.1 MAG: phenylalanine--tRNA ligase subunit beta [candidate division WWE3 bacterium CG_4_10_14_0_2_um_filter_42_7]
MNILVPFSWLKDYLKTDASAKEVTKFVSLCGPSIERIHEVGGEEVFEVEVTPNRPDLLSVIGLAREASAILPRFKKEAEFISLNPEEFSEKGDKDALTLDVTIKNNKLCPRFTAVILDNVVIKESPEIIKKRLELVGTRALNNVIDVTNYSMFDLGQPMHAFDYDKITGHKLILRESKEGETIITLDGVNRKLPEDAIVMEDGSGRLIDLCGIMGGKNSEIDENTKRVLLFVQTYDSFKIRKTCQAISHRTEAAARFEKGIDYLGIISSLQRAVEMLSKNAGARVASNLIDIEESKYQKKLIKADFNKINSVIGVSIEKEEAKAILRSLGFIEKEPDQYEVPSWRYQDVEIEEDLAEEIARIYGYFNLPIILPEGIIPSGQEDKTFYFEDKAKDYLKHQGFSECVTPSATSAEILEKGENTPDKAIKIKNPLSKDFEYLRYSLIPQLLESIRFNKSNFEKIRIFELANVYEKTDKDKLPNEYSRLTGIIFDKKSTMLDLKGTVEGLLSELGIANYDFEQKNNQEADLTISKEVVGFIKSSIDGLMFDLNFKVLLKYVSTSNSYKQIPSVPSVVEDLTFEINKDEKAGPAINFIKTFSNEKISLSAELTDVFEKEDVRAITVKIKYQAKKENLSNDIVAKIRELLIKELDQKFGVTVKTA